MDLKGHYISPLPFRLFCGLSNVCTSVSEVLYALLFLKQLIEGKAHKYSTIIEAIVCLDTPFLKSPAQEAAYCYIPPCNCENFPHLRFAIGKRLQPKFVFRTQEAELCRPSAANISPNPGSLHRKLVVIANIPC
jgi:hypothetical protein